MMNEIEVTTQAAEIRAAASVLLERIQFMRQAGITFQGARDLYETLGYDRIITVKQYRDRYARGGLAKRIVDAMPKATWRGGVELVEDEDPKVSTKFEQEWVDLDTRLSVIARLLRADILAGMSTYSVLLIGAPGNLSDELPRGTPGKLLYLTPFCGGGGPNFGSRVQPALDADCTIQQYDVNTASPRFGLPLTYQLRRTSFSSPDFGPSVHWSRIIHIAEGCLDDEVFGQPSLESVWNLLDDLDKVTGGGAEAFWLRANQGFHINVDKDFKDIKPGSPEMLSIQEDIEKYRHNIDRFIKTRGTEINTLGSDVANFSNPADAILTQIAGARSIPKRILTGSEMGELASSQDRDNWKDQINGRQTSYAGPFILRRLVDRLIQYGYLSTPSKGADAYIVRWPHIQVLTEQEKAEGAAKWAAVNSSMGVTVFSAEEIRDHWFAMEPGDDADTEIWKAELATKMASANKTEGAVLFTDDEIRKTCYGWAPLTPEQKVPITAPERVSATAPTPAVDAQVDPKMGVPKPQVAVDAKTGQPVLKAAEHDFSSTQVDITGPLKDRLLAFGASVSDADVIVDGREDRPHVTVKYGLHTSDPALVTALLAPEAPVEMTLGRSAFFASGEYDVLYVEVDSRCLERLNALLASELAVTNTQATYSPHITIAYLKPGLGPKYAGVTAFDGDDYSSDKVVFSLASDVEIAIRLNDTRDAVRAAEVDAERELLQVLEAAIAANNTDVIDRIIGVRHAGDVEGHEFHGNQYGTRFVPREQLEKMGAFDPRFVQHMVKEHALTQKQATKLHHALTIVDQYMRDPEIGPHMWDVLSSFSPESLHEHIEAMQTGAEHTLARTPMDPYIYKAAETSDEALDKIFELCADPEIGSTLQALILALKPRSLGDVEGHEFHGNQWTSASGAIGGRKGENFVKKAHAAESYGSHSRNINDPQEAAVLFEQTHAALEKQGYKRDSPTTLPFKYQREASLTHPETGSTAKLRKDYFAADPVYRAQGYKGSSRVRLDITKAPKILGDVEGHDFHGNQWTGGRGGTDVIDRPSSAYTPMRPDGFDTKERFSDGRGHYTPERQVLHEAIIAKYLANTTPVDHPQALILGGGMGAGKTTLVSSENLLKDNTAEVNVDKIRSDLPELREALANLDKGGAGVLTAETHEEASDIGRELMRQATADSKNMVLDGTGDTTLDKLGGKVAEMRATGHTINAEYVTVPVETAISRAAERARTTDRREVPATAMREVHAAVSRIFPEAIRQGLFDNARLWNTDVPRGAKPTLIASAKGTEVTVHDQAQWNAFLEKGR